MLQNYSTIAFRNLLKYKGFSLLNGLQLSVGMACFLLSVLYIRYQNGYDTYHKQPEQLYRVEVNEWAGAPFALAPYLKAHYPQVQQAARLFLPLQGLLLRYGNKTFAEKQFLYADSTVFELFTLPFVQGDARTALTKPSSVVITESTARKYFGEQAALGKSLGVVANGQVYPYQVTGVIKDIPAQTHFSADFIASISTLMVSERIQWTDYVYHTYVRLPSPARLTTLSKQLAAYIHQQQPEALRTGQIAVTFQPVTRIHLHSHKERELQANGQASSLYIFLLSALFVVVMASINFMNLATARALSRAKEVGLRKTLGASRSQLVGQFLGEVLLLVMISGVVAVLLTVGFLPAFRSVSGLVLPLTGQEIVPLMGVVVLLLLAVTLLSGLYPAFYLSRYTPTVLLKKQLVLPRTTARYVRHGLLVVQCVISTCLLIGALGIYRQLEFLQNAHLGFHKEQIFIIPTNSQVKKAYPAFKSRLLAESSIRAVTASFNVPGERIIVEKFTLPPAKTQNYDLRVLVTDFDFIETYGLKLVAGRGFSRQFPADSLGAFVINQKAAQYFGWPEPVGQHIHFPLLNTTGAVIGVVEDFHYASLHSEVEPLLLYVSPNRQTYSYVSVKFKAAAANQALQTVGKVYEELFEGLPLEYQFLEDNFAALYRKEHQGQTLVGGFTVLAVGLACLGMVGLAAFTTRQKAREIAIRRVFGASAERIMLALFAPFAGVAGLAFLVAAPLSAYGLNWWLGTFAYRISLSAGVFLLAGLLLALFTLFSVSYRVIRAAWATPVDYLKED